MVFLTCSRISINLGIVLYLPCYIVLICLTSSVVTGQFEPNLCDLELCEYPFENQPDVKIITNKVWSWMPDLQSWRRHQDEFVTYLFSFLNFAISRLNFLKCYDNFSISRVHNICIILYVYATWEIALQWWEGEIYKQMQNTTNTLERLV